LANIELLKEEGEVSLLLLDIATAYYSLRGLVARLRQPQEPEQPKSGGSSRSAWLSLE
jgi:hypothetical protein